MSDWTEPAQSAARKIMTLLGYSQEPSDEPGDRLRDRVAVLVQQAIDARADTRETGLREAAEIDRAWIIQYAHTDMPDEFFAGHGAEQAAHKRFSQQEGAWTLRLFMEVARSGYGPEATIPSPPPPQSGEREVEASIQALCDLIEGYGARNPQHDYERPEMQRARAAIAALNAMRAQEKPNV